MSRDLNPHQKPDLFHTDVKIVHLDENHRAILRWRSADTASCNSNITSVLLEGAETERSRGFCEPAPNPLNPLNPLQSTQSNGLKNTETSTINQHHKTVTDLESIRIKKEESAAKHLEHP